MSIGTACAVFTGPEKCGLKRICENTFVSAAGSAYTGVLLAKKGGETNEHCEISHFGGSGHCGAWHFCL